MTTWLSRQKKTDLVDLANEAGYKGAANMLKDDLIDELASYLRANSSRLAGRSVFDEFYARAKNSPVKKERITPALTSDGESKTPKPRRRTTKAPPDFENGASDVGASIKSAVQDAPAVIQHTVELASSTAEQVVDQINERLPDLTHFAERMPLPPSPSAVTDLVERQTEILAETVNGYWDYWQVTPHLKAVRTNLSSAVGVELTFLAIEIWGLQRATIPWRYAFSTPSFYGYGPFALYFPDFFVLLTDSFWTPTMLWFLTSLLFPLTIAWFFNVTTLASKRHVHQVDPFAFNVAKALLTWLVFQQGFRYGGVFNRRTVLAVDAAMPGGSATVLAGAAIGMLASLYEAVLRR